MVSKAKMDEDDLEGLKREVQIMTKVDHPNIVKYYETYQDPKTIYLVMELCTGGELFSRINETGKAMGEDELAKEMGKLLKALVHCHQAGIIHRDIKPENIMYGADGEIKLIDFGFAIQNKKKKTSMDIAGTPYYIAPEVLTQEYGRECDIWSLGVCIYQVLTGIMPFDSETQSQDELFRKIRKGEFKMPHHISADCKDILKRMICVDPNKRISAKECLSHNWIVNSQKGIDAPPTDSALDS